MTQLKMYVSDPEVLQRLTEMEKQLATLISGEETIMSLLTATIAEMRASFTSIQTGLAGIAARLTALEQNQPTPEELVALQQLKTDAATLATQANEIGAPATPPVIP